MRAAHDSSLCGGSLLGPRLRTRGGVSSVMRVAHDSSLCGGSLLGEPRLRTRREVSSVMRVAHDSSLCGGSQGGISPLRRRGGGRSPSGSFPIAPAAPSAPHLQACIVPKRWKVAAALSAAVTTAKRQGIAPTLHGRTSRKKRTSLFPATLRERGSGGEALLLEKRPLPQFRPAPSLREGARGRVLLYREVPSLAITPIVSLHVLHLEGLTFGVG